MMRWRHRRKIEESHRQAEHEAEQNREEFDRRLARVEAQTRALRVSLRRLGIDASPKEER